MNHLLMFELSRSVHKNNKRFLCSLDISWILIWVLSFLYFLRLFYQDFWILETKTKGTDVPAARNVPLLLSSQWEQLNKYMHVSICKSGMCLLYHQDFIINRWLYFLTSFERFVYFYVCVWASHAIVFTLKSG